MSLLDELPPTEEIRIETLGTRLASGEVLVYAEGIGYTNQEALLCGVGSDVDGASLERLANPETYNLDWRFNRSLKVWKFRNQREKADFFGKFGQAVQTLEIIEPLAQSYRQGAIKEIRKLNQQVRAVVRSINFEEKTLAQKSEEQKKLERVLISDEFNTTVYQNIIRPTFSDNPIILLYFSSNKNEFEHAFQVTTWANAIAYRAGERDENMLRELTVASLLSGVSDYGAELLKLDKEGEPYRYRDFLIPLKLFKVGKDDEEFNIDGITNQEIEIMSHRHSRRDGREAELAGNRYVYLPTNINRSQDASGLLHKEAEYLEMQEQGNLTIRNIESPLYGALYLAEKFVSSVERHGSSLNALAETRTIKRERGFCADPHFVDAFLELVEEKYSRGKVNRS
jgi:hypothetical protein